MGAPVGTNGHIQADLSNRVDGTRPEDTQVLLRPRPVDAAAHVREPTPSVPPAHASPLPKPEQARRIRSSPDAGEADRIISPEQARRIRSSAERARRIRSSPEQARRVRSPPEQARRIRSSPEQARRIRSSPEAGERGEAGEQGEQGEADAHATSSAGLFAHFPGACQHPAGARHCYTSSGEPACARDRPRWALLAVCGAIAGD
jgi:hypothetical protein